MGLMKLYTGSFRDFVKYRDKYTVVAISTGVPKWYKDKRYKKLAPPYSLMSQYRYCCDCDETDVEMYIQQYCDTVLNPLTPLEVFQELENMSDGKDVILLTQESSDEFSHRHLVSAWFNNAGIECREFI